jgi:hypothetical protein
MGYEFVRDDGQENGPVSPDFWRYAPKRISQIMPNEIVMVRSYSVIHDPENGTLGIDTHDHLPEIPNTSQPPVAIMKVSILSGDQVVEGYLIDLRRKRFLEERSLPFDEPDELMQGNETVKPLGAVFRDSFGRLYLATYAEYNDLLLPYAMSMVEGVDRHIESDVGRTDELNSRLHPQFLRPNAS